MPNLISPSYDFERAIDDWICLCLLIRNDCLPPLSSLENGENVIEKLVQLYKDTVLENEQWLTNSGFFELEMIKTVMDKLDRDQNTISFR